MLLAEPALQGPAYAHQRVNGSARIAFVASDGCSRLADLYQRAPCRVLFPNVEPTDPPQAVLLTTSGGLTGGDRLRVDIRARTGSHATLTTQAAEKIYRALPDEGNANIDVHIDAASGACIEWLAQETIVFDGARLRRGFSADMAADARLLAVESLVLGRAAMNETLRRGYVHDSWRIRRDDRLVFADALHLDGDIAGQRTMPFGFADATACGTLVYAAPEAPSLLDYARACSREHALVAHVTTREHLLIVRFLARHAVDLRAAIISLTGAIREAALGRSRRLPQVWYC